MPERLMTLDELRRHRGLTQRDVGRGLGVSQQRVAKIEDRGVSSLTIRSLDRYVSSMGGQLNLSISFPDGEVQEL
jgi:transcriptional regulator with XRE-family HTH domain